MPVFAGFEIVVDLVWIQKLSLKGGLPPPASFFRAKFYKMINRNSFTQTRADRRVSSAYPLLIVFLSLVAIVLTFLLANSSAETAAKTGGFFTIIATFLIVCASIHLWKRRRALERPMADRSSEADVEHSLAFLDEAGEFFAGSLKSADTFRFVANRVCDLLPFRAAVLYLLDGTRTQLRVAETEGMATYNKDQTFGFEEGLAGLCYSNSAIEIDSDLSLDSTQDFASSVAIPLLHGLEVFGILELYFGPDFDMRKADRSLFEAVGTRVAPLLLTSIAFEQSEANALTDVTTDLPNERAFYLILENQIAEAQRKREERPLSILAIDIKNFDDINQRFGHAAGDRALNLVAQVVRDDLRQM